MSESREEIRPGEYRRRCSLGNLAGGSYVVRRRELSHDRVVESMTGIGERRLLIGSMMPGDG